MEVFFDWVNEGDHRTVFENCTAMQMYRVYLQGVWGITQKIRFIRLIRKLIERAIVVKSVEGVFEEGCRILCAMEDEAEDGMEDRAREDQYRFELYLLKIRGVQRKMKYDEVAALRSELKEANQKKEESEKNTEEEKRKREEAERGREEEKKRADEEKRKKEEEIKKREESEKRRRETEERRRGENSLRTRKRRREE